MRPRRRRAGDGDEGFTLVEVIVAIVIVGLVMVSAAPFMVSALNSVSGQSKRQTAAALADQALDLARGVRTAQLVQGRTAADVDALRTPGTTLVDLSQDDRTSATAIAATTSAAASTVLVPTTVTRTVSNVSYQVRTFVEACWLDGTCQVG